MNIETRRSIVGLTVAGAVFLLGGVFNVVSADSLPHPEYATFRSIVLGVLGMAFLGAAEISGRPRLKRKE